MPVTITDGTTALVPMLIIGRAWNRPSRNKRHDIISSPYPDMTLAEAGARTGRLDILCADANAMTDMEALHRAAGVLTLTDDEVPEQSMRYTLTDGGGIDAALDPATSVRWILSVDFQEVAP